MITVKEVFMTSDNMAFGSRSEAENHERNSVREWLASNPEVNLNSILDTFNDINDDEYFCTEKDLAMRFVTRAFEYSQEGKNRYPDAGN